MEPILHVGKEFFSYGEVQEALLKYKAEKHVKFVIKNSTRVSSRNKKLLAEGSTDLYNKNLKYCYVTYTCKLGGKKRINKGRAVRPKQSTYKKGCKAKLHLIAEKTKLVVRQLVEVHNHKVSKEVVESFPESRKLLPEQERDVKLLAKAGVKPSLIRVMLRSSGDGKCRVTQRDLANYRARWKKAERGGLSEEEKLIETLEKLSQADPGVFIFVGKSEGSDDLLFLFIQTTAMKECVKKFGRVILLDHTYKINRNRMPVAVFMVRDGNGRGRPAGYAFVANEQLTTVSTVITAFKQGIGDACAQNIKTFVVDKDPSEIGAIKAVFGSQVNVQLCDCHVGKTLHDRTHDQPPEVRTILRKMRHCESEDYFQTLADDLQLSSTKKFFDYFKTNWLECPESWAYCDKMESINYGNTTTNLVEVHNSKVKMVLNHHNALYEAVDGLLHVVQNKEDDVFFEDTTASIKESYIMHCDDPIKQKCMQDFTQFAANLMLQALDEKVSYDEVVKYKASSDTCTCLQYKSYHLPCKHMVQARRQAGEPEYDICNIDPMWLKERSPPDAIDNTIFGVHSEVFPEKGMPTRPNAKYRKAKDKCLQICSTLRDNGRKQFAERYAVLDAIFEIWSDKGEVAVVRKYQPTSAAIPAPALSSQNGDDDVGDTDTEEDPVELNTPSSAKDLFAKEGNKSVEVITIVDDDECFDAETTNIFHSLKCEEMSMNDCSTMSMVHGASQLPVVNTEIELDTASRLTADDSVIDKGKSLVEVVTIVDDNECCENANTNVSSSTKVEDILMNDQSDMSVVNGVMVLTVPDASDIPTSVLDKSSQNLSQLLNLLDAETHAQENMHNVEDAVPHSPLIVDANVASEQQIKCTVNSGTAHLQHTSPLQQAQGSKESCNKNSQQEALRKINCFCKRPAIRLSASQRARVPGQIFYKCERNECPFYRIGKKEEQPVRGKTSTEQKNGQQEKCNISISADSSSLDDGNDDELLLALDSYSCSTTDPGADNTDNSVNRTMPACSLVRQVMSNVKLPKSVKHKGRPAGFGKTILGQPKRKRELKKDSSAGPHVPKKPKGFLTASKNPQEERQARGLEISDDDVCVQRKGVWIVKSQAKESNNPYTVNKLSCVSCEDEDVCSLCLSCTCRDFVCRKKACKHIFKVASLSAYQEKEVPKTCAACSNGHLPSGAHKCAICETFVHLFDGCSAPFSDEEGYGQQRICIKCASLGTAEGTLPPQRDASTPTASALEGHEKQKKLPQTICSLCRKPNNKKHKCTCAVCSKKLTELKVTICYRCLKTVHSECSSIIRAEEKNDAALHICSNCSTSKEFGISVDALKELHGEDLLSDEHFVVLSRMIRTKDPNIDGLQTPSVGVQRQKNGTIFVDIDENIIYPPYNSCHHYVQVMHTSHNHWVLCIIPKGVHSRDKVYIYDSIRFKHLSTFMMLQIARILQCPSEKIEVVYPNFPEQSNGSNCGVYAIAMAVHFALTNSLISPNFEEDDLRSHWLQIITTKQMTPFPESGTPLKRRPSKKKGIEVVCYCRMPEFYGDDVAQCVFCRGWFHINCIENGDHLKRSWKCNNCVRKLKSC